LKGQRLGTSASLAGQVVNIGQVRWFAHIIQLSIEPVNKHCGQGSLEWNLLDTHP